MRYNIPMPTPKSPPAIQQAKKYLETPFGDYFRQLDVIDQGFWKYTDEFGSFLILSLVEEVGEMARAYLAKHGRKASNLAAQEDETYQQELGDLLLTILRFARRGYIPRVKINSKMIRFDLDEVVRALKHYVTKV